MPAAGRIDLAQLHATQRRPPVDGRPWSRVAAWRGSLSIQGRGVCVCVCCSPSSPCAEDRGLAYDQPGGNDVCVCALAASCKSPGHHTPTFLCSTHAQQFTSLALHHVLGSRWRTQGCREWTSLSLSCRTEREKKHRRWRMLFSSPAIYSIHGESVSSNCHSCVQTNCSQPELQGRWSWVRRASPPRSGLDDREQKYIQAGMGVDMLDLGMPVFVVNLDGVKTIILELNLYGSLCRATHRILKQSIPRFLKGYRSRSVRVPPNTIPR